MGDIIIHMLSLPCRVHALTIPDEDGNFTVIVNDVLDDMVQRNALEHELQHINLDHFYDENDVAIDEKEACQNDKSGDLRKVQFG